PEEPPMVPLQQDLERERRRLRLPQDAREKIHDLDLRNANDLARSHLLHRLLLVGVEWGAPQRPQQGARGTFHEIWKLRWTPELAVSLIEAGVWGNTVADAAAARAESIARQAPDLPALTAVLENVLAADLPDAVRRLMARIE